MGRAVSSRFDGDKYTTRSQRKKPEEMERHSMRVLLATDGSEDAALAARAATEISGGIDAELHVVHVLPQFPRYAFPGVTPELYSYVLDRTDQETRDLLDEQVRHIEDSGGRVVETHTKRGPAVDEILDLAQELGVGLITLGSRGLGPLKNLVLGSVSEGVVHHAPCPVLVLRGGPGTWPPEEIVVGDDGSEEAKDAGELGSRIAGLFDAKGLLVRVYPQLPEMDLEGRGLDARTVDDELRREERKLQERAKEIKEALGSRPRIRLSVGDPAPILLETAEEGAAAERTLIAVGSRGLGVLRRMRLGSVSTKVLRASKGPVLIFPRVGEEVPPRNVGSRRGRRNATKGVSP
jgi:nucleotide-binding universal stress UspA family protein